MRFSLLQLLLSATAASAASIDTRQTLSGSNVCKTIASQISGGVYYPLSGNYINGVQHYMTSSSATPMCVVEVANAEDVSAVMQVIAATRTPFAVKSGGHASNPGFSSTTGVHISLVRLNQVSLSADKKTVEIGTGLVSTQHVPICSQTLTVNRCSDGLKSMMPLMEAVSMSLEGELSVRESEASHSVVATPG